MSLIAKSCSHGLIGERLAKLNRMWTELFESAFAENYETIHRRETSQLRNNAKFWGHMLSNDAISWHVLSVISLNEDDTTSSSRIFMKILVQDIVEALGMKEVQRRFKDEILRPNFAGLFPVDNPRNTRFSINYFTSIGMGALTEGMREHLKSVPQPAAVIPTAKDQPDTDSVSSYSSYSSYTGSSRSYSRSRSPSGSRGRAGRAEAARQRRRQYSSSRTPPPLRRGPAARGGGQRSWTRSESPREAAQRRHRDQVRPRRGRSYSSSDHSSRSPSPSRGHRRRNSSYSSRSRSPPSKAYRRRRSLSYSSRSRTPPQRQERPRRD